MKKYIIMSILLLTTIFTMAQITGETSIKTDGTSYTYTVNLPNGMSFQDANAIIYTWGGIDTVSVNRLTNEIEIVSKQGITKDEYFSKYGKGRLWVAYDDGTCGYWKWFDIYKKFDMTNAISKQQKLGYTIMSPSCMREGDTVTVAVTPIVTMAFPHSPLERYDWHFPPNLMQQELFYALDSSSVTFVVGEVNDDDEISVKLGLYNFNNPNNQLTRKIYKAPQMPEIIGDNCIQFGNDATFEISQETKSDYAVYTWYVNDDIVIDRGGSDDKLTLTSTDKFASFDKLTIRVEANAFTGNCFGYIVDTFYVVRGFSNEYSSVIEENSKLACYSVADEQSFRIEPRVNADIVWNIPTEKGRKDTILNGNASLRIVVPNKNQLTEQVSARVLNAECTETLIYNYNIRPGKIDNVLCLPTIDINHSYQYEVQQTLQPTPINYQWTIPEAFNEKSLTGNVINLTTVNHKDKLTPFNVIAVGENSCNADPFDVVVGYAPTPVGAITLETPCLNINMPTEDVIFKTNNNLVDIQGHNLVWTFPKKLFIKGATGDSIIIRENTNTVKLNSILGTPDDYVVTCYSESGNNVSAHVETYTFSIVDELDVFDIDAFPKNLSYLLVMKDNSSLNLNPNNLSMIVKYNGNIVDTAELKFLFGDYVGVDKVPKPLPIGYVIGFTYKKTNDCYIYKEVKGNANSKKGKAVYSNNNKSSKSQLLRGNNTLFKLYPNPTDNFINIKITNLDKQEIVNIDIYDMIGKLMYKNQITDNQITIDISKFKSANYIIIVRKGDNYQIEKVVKK